MDPADLEPNGGNWRAHPQAQLVALKDVVAEVGWAGALLWNERTKRLVDGHARRELFAGQKVPVLVGSWTEEQERKILATLDPLSAMAEADAAKLAALLAEIDTESEAVQSLLDSLAHDNPQPITPGAGGDEFDATPEAGPTRTQTGDVWLIGGKHRLLVGDCTDAGNVVLLMNGAKPELCFTSPPYNLGASVGLRNGAFRGKGTAYTGASGDDDPQRWRDMMDWFTDAALKCCRYTAVNVQLLAGNKRELIGWLANFADRVADVYVWVKSNPQPAMAERVASSAFEFVVVLSAEPNPTRAIDTASFPRGTFSNAHTSAVGNNSHTDGWHGATFPVDLAGHYVGNLTPPGARVYDPFIGSGTTLIAAHRLGRVCYGCEIEPKYADVILRRAEAEGLTVEKVGNA